MIFFGMLYLGGSILSILFAFQAQSVLYPFSVHARAHLYDGTPEVLTPCIEMPFDEYEKLGCPVLILYYSFWCHHCRTLAPAYKSFAIETTFDRVGTHVFAVDCMKHGDTCVKAGIKSVPVLKYFDGKSWSFLKDPPGNFTSLHLPDTIIESNLPKQIECRAHRAKEVIRQSKRLKREVSTSRDLEVNFDFDDALIFSLENEVPPCVAWECEPESEKLELDDPFNFPLDNHDAEFQHRVYCSLRRLVLDNLPYVFDQPRKKSVHSSEGKTCSYTCGLWKLFHRLLQGNNAQQSLFIIRNYILTFFRCKTCRTHFAEMCKNDLTARNVYDNDSARLWLWRAHNQVNARIDKPFWPHHMNSTSTYTNQDILKILEKSYGAFSTNDMMHQVKDVIKSLMNRTSMVTDVIFSKLFR
uniref:Sulfhydryl oxidase n=1 Tax=Paramoeba aestuarina TaxID=180227 RepID=A0A7S4NME5_9EUKA